MKLEELKVGMRLQDPYGNVYKVRSKEDAHHMVVLECLSLHQAVRVEYDYMFKAVRDTLWVHADRQTLLNIDTPDVRRISDVLGIHDVLNPVSIQIQYGDIKADFSIVPDALLKGCEVTLADMELLSEAANIDTVDVKIGLQLQDMQGNTYIVVDVGDCFAMLYCTKATAGKHRGALYMLGLQPNICASLHPEDLKIIEGALK